MRKQTNTNLVFLIFLSVPLFFVLFYPVFLPFFPPLLPHPARISSFLFPLFLPVFPSFLKHARFVTILKTILRLFTAFSLSRIRSRLERCLVLCSMKECVSVKPSVSDTRPVNVAVSREELGYIIDVLLKTCFSGSGDVH